MSNDTQTQTTQTDAQPTEQTGIVHVDIFHADWTFDRSTPEEERAYEFRLHGSDVDDPLTLAEFSRLFDHVGSDTVEVEADTDDSEILQRVYEAWNMTGWGLESDVFLDARVRSLSVGDIVQIGEQLYMVDRFGFGGVGQFHALEGGDR